MLKKLSNFDVFGQPFAFNAHKSSATFTTVIGGILTIFWIVLVSLVAYRIFGSYLDTTKPVVSVNRIRLERPPYLNYSEGQMGTVYMFFDGQKLLTTEEAKRFVTVRGKYINMYQEGGKIIEKEYPYTILDCSQMSVDWGNNLSDQSFSEVEFGGIDYETLFNNALLCGDLPGHLAYTEGSRFSLPYGRTFVTTYPCSLPDRTKCASVQELSAFQIIFLSVVRVGEFKNKSEPLSFFFDTDVSLYIDIASRTKMTHFAKMNYIYDDDVGLLEERLSHKYMDVDRVVVTTGSRVSLSTYSTAKEIDEGACDPYLEQMNRSGFDKMVIQRRYKQFFGVISEIGGFNDLIIYSILMVYFLYRAFAYKNLIRAHLKADLTHFEAEGQGPDLKQDGVENKYRVESERQSEERERRAFMKQLNYELSKLPDVKLVIKTNSKAKVLLEMILLRFPALAPLLPKMILQQKIKSRKEQEGKNSLQGAPAPQNDPHRRPKSKRNAKRSILNINRGTTGKEPEVMMMKNQEDQPKSAMNISGESLNLAPKSHEEQPQPTITDKKIENQPKFGRRNSNTPFSPRSPGSGSKIGNRRFQFGVRRKINPKSKFAYKKAGNTQSSSPGINLGRLSSKN